jgi:hypothetical protein
LKGQKTMSNIMNYLPEVLANIASVLARIEANEGKITGKFLKSEIERLKGQWAPEVINVALMALGREAAVSGMVASEGQVGALVKMAQKDHAYIISKIKSLREAREKQKSAPPAQEPTITVVDLDNDLEPPFELKDDVMDVGEAAVVLGVSERRVRAMLSSGRFELARKPHGVWLINGNEVRMIVCQERKAGRPSNTNLRAAR